MSPKKVVTFGEIMMRLSTPAWARFTQADQFNVIYAGSEANVAVSLSIFGIPSMHVTRFPENDFGKAAAQALQKFNVDTRAIVYGKERMGVYFLENGAIHRSSRIIYDRFDSAFANVRPGMVDWDTIFSNTSWFHWTGITPAISQGAADVCAEAIRSARRHGLVISGDINYRRNLWQYGKTARDIMAPLIESSDTIVAGTTDMENCTGVSGDSYETCCRKFMKTFPSVKLIASTERTVINSSHNRIRGLLWNGKELLSSKEYDLTHIVDRVGAGDAFMSGLIYGGITNLSNIQALEFATAACALKHTVEGDVSLSSVEEVEALVRGENVGKLLR